MNRTLAIAVVGPLPPPAGGMANQTRQLLQLLETEGVRTMLVQTNAAYVPSWVGKLRGVRALFRLMPYLARLWAASARADVMHLMANSGLAWFVFAWPALIVARIRRVPVIVNYRGGLAAEFLERHHRRVVPSLLRAALIVVPSKFLQQIFSRYGVPSLTIPNVVNLELFQPASGRHFDPTRPQLLVARNLEAIYGVDLALRAMPKLVSAFPDLRLTIAGSGPERAALEQLARSLEVEQCVTFTGLQTPQQMAQLYSSSDLLLNPTRADNMPNSLLEAMASGVPVVTTAVGGIPFMVEQGQTAWFIEARTSDAVADAVLEVLGNQPLRQRLIANGLQLVQSNSWQRVRSDWLGAYQDIIARQSLRAREGSPT